MAHITILTIRKITIQQSDIYQIGTMNTKTVAALQLVSFATFFYTANAHVRLECPPPRTGETGAKIGPCDADDDLSLPAYPLVPGALNTITWLESLGHPGAPGRLALSLEGADEGFESCILLDHIPHDERSQPNIQDQTSYHRAAITVFIPDVYCERCHLQFISVMSDEIHQLPIGETCAYRGAQTAGTADADLDTCQVVYHSCAPVSINGTTPRDEYQCSLDSFMEELEWPFMEGKPPASTYFYKGDPGMYDRQLAVLQSGGEPIEGCSDFFYCDPEEFYRENIIVEEGAKYAELHGTCAAMVNMVVEPFALGSLPSTPLANTVTATPPATSGTMATTNLTIVDLAVAAPDLSTLVELVTAAGLVETLSGEGPFTVFAPTNAAFEAVPAETMEALAADVDLLTSVLTYHVVPGVIMSTDLAEGAEVSAVSEGTLTVTSLTPPTINESEVVFADIMASNGVVHVINAVLMPPAEEEEPAEDGAVMEEAPVEDGAAMEEAPAEDGAAMDMGDVADTVADAISESASPARILSTGLFLATAFAAIFV